MRHRVSGMLIILSGTFALAAAAPPVVATDSAPTGGRAASTGTVLEVIVGDTVVTFSSDRSASRHGLDATATMVIGATGDAEVGRIAAERTNAGTRRNTLGPGSLNLGGAGVFNVADSEVIATLEDDDRAVSRVTTSVLDAELATVGQSGVVNQEVVTSAGAGHSRSQRTVQVADVTILTLDQLLDALNLGLLSLPCDSIGSIAATLGAPPTDACEQLNEVLAQLTAALSVLEGARGDAEALRDATQPLVDAQQAVVDALAASVDQITIERDALLATVAGLNRNDLEAALADLQVEIAALQPLCTIQGLFCDLVATLTAETATITGQLAAFDELDVVLAELAGATANLAAAQAVLDALDTTLAGALSILDALDLAGLGGDPTCDDASTALTEAAGLVPALAAAADTARTALDAVCAELASELEALLDAPLLSLGGVEVLMDARTAADEATSIVDGTIGSITIGALPPTAQALEIDDGPALEAAASDIGDALETVLSSLGFAAPNLDVELLRTIRSTDIADDGSSRANAGLALLDLRAPATPTSLPAVSPFGPLAGLLPDASGPNGNVTLPAFRVTAGSFSASSSFPVAAITPPPTGGGGSGSGGTGDGLPLTGVEHQADLAALLFLAAHLLRRFIQARAS